jgi:acetylglutamate kinase
MKDASLKAGILKEALPYIRRWSGKVVVIKVGGESLQGDSLLSLATDIALLRYVGMRPLIVHGAGPQITAEMERVNLQPEFIDGHRVTDEKAIDLVVGVLMKVNGHLVDAIRMAGVAAVGLSGADASLISVEPARLGEGQDLGFVGDIKEIDPAFLDGLLSGGSVPIVAPLGRGEGGIYNINADTAASALAVAVEAQKIVIVTNVAGLYADLGDVGSLVSRTTPEHLRSMIEGGSLSKGMLPKVRAVLDALAGGVPQAHILDGRVEHALLLEIFTDEGIGTLVTP